MPACFALSVFAVLQLGAQSTTPRSHPVEPPAPALGYALDGGGLANPTWDGGDTEVEMGDVNQDGHPDVVTIGDHGSPNIGSPMHGLTIWFGNGAGGWTAVSSGDFGYGGTALGDVNGDGMVDVAYGMHHNYSGVDFGDQLLEAALGDGSGLSWLPWDDGLATNGETYGLFAVDLGDVDSDGDLDLGAGSFGCCAGVHVYTNLGGGAWSQSFGYLGGNASQQFLFADFNGDGHLDLAGGNSTDNVLIGTGTGSFLAADGNLPASSYSGMAAGDVDGDGDDELVYAAGNGAVQAWAFVGPNQWAQIASGLPASGPARMVDVADMDSDGRRDVVAVGAGKITVYRGLGGGAFTAAWSGQTPDTGSKTLAALRAGTDLDHNGRSDFAFVEDVGGAFSSVNKLRVWRETSQPGELGLRVLEPSSGRTWRGGQARFVSWTSAIPPGAPGAPGRATVELSPHGLAGPWQALAAGVPNSGRAQVLVPGGLRSDQCLIRITLALDGDVTFAGEKFFTIVP